MQGDELKLIVITKLVGDDNKTYTKATTSRRDDWIF